MTWSIRECQTPQQVPERLWHSGGGHKLLLTLAYAPSSQGHLQYNQHNLMRLGGGRSRKTPARAKWEVQECLKSSKTQLVLCSIGGGTQLEDLVTMPTTLPQEVHAVRPVQRRLGRGRDCFALI